MSGCPICSRKDCIVSPEWHGRCAAEGIPGHSCHGSRLTPQHLPKKGMGGNNPKSRVVAYLDVLIHDAIDNGGRYEGLRLRDGVDVQANGRRVYVIWDRDRKEDDTLVEIRLEALDTEGGGTGQEETPAAIDGPPAPPSMSGASEDVA